MLLVGGCNFWAKHKIISNMANIQTKPKRVRLSPNKKRMVDEEKALVEFLLENKDIEKPTAQLYYKRFADEKGTAIEWKLARTKVRNMRLSYNKAKSWDCSTGAGSMDGDTIKNTLHRMCRFYDAFDDIFGSRFVDAAIVEDSITSITTSDLENTEVVFESTVTSDSSIMDTGSMPSTSRKGIYSRMAVSDIMEMQAEAMKIKKLKLDQDGIFKEKEIQIKEREIALKEKELELKEKELLSGKN